MEGFAFIASHDLQEPLRKIQAFGGVLENQLKPKLTPDEVGYFNRMRNAAARMSLMIQDLLDYSRVPVYNRSAISVDLNEIVSAVVDNLETRIEHTQGQVTASELPALLVDPLHMRQLFQYLVGNALKFHHPGIPPVVNIYHKDGSGEGGADGFVEICVADNGIGFEPEHIDGKITARCQPGGGATFTITFPSQLLVEK